MKFIKSSLFKKIKFILLLTLLLSNVFVEATENIKLHKLMFKNAKGLNSNENLKFNSTIKLMRAGNRISLIEKLKNLLIGFLAAMVVKLLSSRDKISQDLELGKKGNYSSKDKILYALKISADFCFEKTIREYQVLKKQSQQRKACNPEIVDKLLVNKKVDVETVCQEKKMIEELDSNEYSTKRVLIQGFKGLFRNNSEFRKGYKNFKRHESRLKKNIKALNKEVIPHLYKIKKSLEKNKKKKRSEEYKVLKQLLKNMGGISSNNVCKGIEKCASLTPFQHLKIFVMLGLSFLKCAVQAQVKEFLNNKFKDLITDIFKRLGFSIVGNILGAVFPGILVGLITKFIFNNLGLISKIVKSSLGLRSETGYNADAELYQDLGRLLGNILIAVTGIKKRKLKKLRKLD